MENGLVYFRFVQKSQYDDRKFFYLSKIDKLVWNLVHLQYSQLRINSWCKNRIASKNLDRSIFPSRFHPLCLLPPRVSKSDRIWLPFLESSVEVGSSTPSNRITRWLFGTSDTKLLSTIENYGRYIKTSEGNATQRTNNGGISSYTVQNQIRKLV